LKFHFSTFTCREKVWQRKLSNLSVNQSYARFRYFISGSSSQAGCIPSIVSFRLLTAIWHPAVHHCQSNHFSEHEERVYVFVRHIPCFRMAQANRPDLFFGKKDRKFARIITLMYFSKTYLIKFKMSSIFCDHFLSLEAKRQIVTRNVRCFQP
jgi:hypothetical protein